MIRLNTVTDTVKRLCIEANYFLGEDCVSALESAVLEETSPLGKDIISKIIENIKTASNEKMPMCQDTGITVVFIDIGIDADIERGSIRDAVNEGVRRGYRDGYLRKSVVKDPLRRNNTGDNTPAVIYYDMVPGDNIKIMVVPKGGGSENMSRVKMLRPQSGGGAVEEFVVNTVRQADGNPCPPVVVGVGIGGTFEKSALLAKRALLRKLSSRHKDAFYADMENRLLEKINRLGIGPMGTGGKTTALGVFIEAYPCHIASLPVSVNIQCWAARHRKAVL